jgi:transposase-like protein
MAPKKLSDSDKQEILNLYRQPGETTSTLAERYGVSNTTISRILKSSLAEQEYEALVQQKRQAGKSSSSKGEPEAEPLISLPSVEETKPAPEQSEAAPSSERRARPRSDTKSRPITKAQRAEEQNAQLPLLNADFGLPTAEPVTEGPALESLETEVAAIDESLEDEDFLDEDAAFGSDEDLDFDDDDEDDDDLDEDDEADDMRLAPIHVENQVLIRVLPLSEAALPRPCYLVVDRAAELITRPLKEFGHLGQIPSEEIMERTLPVFDNHRVARRFSRKNQRVVKVPDGRMLEKTSEYLHAKGITRLLIDGQVYSVLN